MKKPHCKDCRIVFPFQSLLEKHDRKRHDGKRKNHNIIELSEVNKYTEGETKCTIYLHVFASKNYLAKHKIRMHNKGDKKFKCEHCEFREYSQGDVNKHVKLTHLKEGTIECPTCGNMFYNSSNLRKHVKMFI